MSLSLIGVNEENKTYFLDKIVELVKGHDKYAKEMGIFDRVVNDYDIEDAMKHFNDKDYRHYVIVNDNVNCGVLQVQLKESAFDGSLCLHICKILSDKSVSGVLRFVIEALKERFPEISSFELECWYDLPANVIYEHLGFQCYCKSYRLKI